MTLLRVLVVDDESLALDRLTALFRQIPDVQVVGTASDGIEAAAAIEQLRPDIVMLDIQMPEKSGLAVAADLAPEDRPEIIFVTAFEQFATDAFQVEATDYLMKPVRFDRLRQAVERAKRRRAMSLAAQRVAGTESTSTDTGDSDAIWVQVRDGSLRVPIDQIDWIEAARDYVLLHTATRSHIHRTTMGRLESKVGASGLMRVHRSAFVRPSLVDHVQRHANGSMSLTLSDGAVVQVGPTYAAKVMARLKL